MPEMHLRQPGFMYIACGPFRKNKARIQKFKETGDSWYTYQNELHKACFQHDMAYGLKALNIAKNLKYDEYQHGLASIVYTFFNKKTSGSGIKNKNFVRPAISRRITKTNY